MLDLVMSGEVLEVEAEATVSDDGEDVEEWVELAVSECILALAPIFGQEKLST